MKAAALAVKGIQNQFSTIFRKLLFWKKLGKILCTKLGMSFVSARRSGEDHFAQDSGRPSRGRDKAGQRRHPAKAEHAAPLSHPILQVGTNLNF